MTTELPAWAYDVVIDLLDQRDRHPELLYTSGAFEGTAKYDWCPCRALDHVPADVRDRAEAIRSYKQQTAPREEGATE